MIITCSLLPFHMTKNSDVKENLQNIQIYQHGYYGLDRTKHSCQKIHEMIISVVGLHATSTTHKQSIRDANLCLDWVSPAIVDWFKRMKVWPKYVRQCASDRKKQVYKTQNSFHPFDTDINNHIMMYNEYILVERYD